MAGYYKQSRPTGKHFAFQVTATTPGGSISKEQGQIVQPGIQTTLSYRTEGGGGQLVDMDDQQVRLGFPTGDTGHVFDTVKQTVRHTPLTYLAGFNNAGYHYSGYAPIIPVWRDASHSFMPAPAMDQNYINYHGAKLIQAATPTVPQSDTLLTLLEILREGLPSIPLVNTMKKERLESPQNAVASENLNFQFGVKPLVSSVQDILKAIVTAPDLLEQLRADSGKTIRRRRSTPIEDVTSIYEVPAEKLPEFRLEGGNYVNFLFGGIPRKVEVLERTSQTLQFVGAFQYFLDVGDDALSKLRSFEQQANYLLGLRLTPQVLWNLAPWSWLADWFGNMNAILGNVSSFSSDSLVLKYGYLTRETMCTRYYSYYPPSYSIAKDRVWSSAFRTIRKERARATPYGFGLQMPDFSPTRIGILASLAQTRHGAGR